jgi:hypothetical protein
MEYPAILGSCLYSQLSSIVEFGEQKIAQLLLYRMHRSSPICLLSIEGWRLKTVKLEKQLADICNHTPTRDKIRPLG